MRKMLICCAAALVLGACSNSENELQPKDGRVNVVTNIEGTRAPQLDNNGSGNFSKGDMFLLSVSNGSQNIKSLEYAVGKTKLYWQDLNIPSGVSNVKFTGCYPKPQGVSANSFVFNASEAEEKDLLLTSATSVSVNSNQAVGLNFKHAMHKIVVSYTNISGVTEESLNEIRTSVHAKYSCRVNLLEGTTTSEGSQSAVTNTGKSAEFYLPSQAVQGISLDVEYSGVKKTLQLSSLLSGKGISMLDSGKVLKVNLNIGKNGVSVGNTSIQGWEDQGTIEGTVEF